MTPKTVITIVLAVFPFSCSTPVVRGDTLSDRLAQQTRFQPRSKAPPEQLIEVAEKFSIPMAIEWLEQPGQGPATNLVFSSGTVLELLDAIVRSSPAHHITVADQIVYVCPTAFTEHPFNFLNLRISYYRVTNDSVLGAQYSLRHSINNLLYPELYKYGSNGGYGSSPDDPFWKSNISISGDNLTIRAILTRIVVAHGNAVWIVRLRPDEFAGGKPYWYGVPLDAHGHSPLNARWKFIHLDTPSSK